MIPSQRCANLVRKYEGCSLKAYLCPSGIPTIFFGATIYKTGIKVKIGDTGTMEQAIDQLQFDLAKFAHGVDGLVKVPLEQEQYDAIVSLAYNIGLGNLGSSSFLRILNTGNYTQAAPRILLWNKGMVKGVLTVLPGLVKRRQEEMELFLSGEPDITFADAESAPTVCPTCGR